MTKLAGWSLIGASAVVILGGITGTPPWKYLRAVVGGDKKTATTVKPFSTIPVVSGGTGAESDTGITGGTGGIGGVISVIREQIGKSYLWGAEGPNLYDCSGLIKYGYKNGAGIDLPHHAADQQKMSTPANGPAAGVLFFLGHPAYHVGMCVSDTQQIEAPDVGLKVRQAPIPKGAYFGVIPA